MSSWSAEMIFLVLMAAVILVPVILILGAAWWRYAGDRRAWLTNRRPREYTRAKRGKGMGVAELAKRLALDLPALQLGWPSYERREIRKRRGGYRVLHVPGTRTKQVQRAILRRLLARLRSHPAACGFEQGLSIVDNARPHVGRPMIVRIDLVDFFPSTKTERVDAYFRRIGWDAEAAALLVKWTTHRGGLPQGAPTSPRLSNLVNYYLDVQLTKHMSEQNGRYTRYADDITLSLDTTHPRVVRGRIQFVRRLMQVHGYQIHGRPKLRAQPWHKRQQVTGLIVNEQIHLPRETRRWLRAVRHHKATGRRATLTDEQLQGWTALEQMVERQRDG